MKLLRCSELDRVLSCPGSATLVPLVTPRKGEEGSEGTALHFLAHDQMIRDLSAIGPVPWEKPPMPASVRFSHWISDYYFNFVKETAPADWSLQVELAIADDWPEFTLSGHIDAVAISPDATEAIGFDLKTGYDPVDAADENEQILGYAVLLLRAWPTLRKITFHVVQPRNDEDEGYQRVSSVVLEGALLENAPDSLAARISAALAANMQLESSRKQCRWCSVQLQCPALQKELEFMKHSLTPEELARVKAQPDDATLGDWIISMRTLRQPTDDAEALVKERIAANGAVDAGCGTRITMKIQGGSYSYPDKPAFYRALTELVPDADARARALKFSVTETREVIADVMGIPKTGKKAPVTAEGVFDAKLRPLVVQGERKVLQFSA